MPKRLCRFLRNGDDGVRPVLQFTLDFGATPSVGPTPFTVMCALPLSPFGHAAIQDYLDVGVGGESLPQVLVQVGMTAGDDKDVSPHLLLAV
jgi:hypothetical protein